MRMEIGKNRHGPQALSLIFKFVFHRYFKPRCHIADLLFYFITEYRLVLNKVLLLVVYRIEHRSISPKLKTEVEGVGLTWLGGVFDESLEVKIQLVRMWLKLYSNTHQGLNWKKATTCKWLSPDLGPGSHGTGFDVGTFNLRSRMDNSRQALPIFGTGLDRPNPGPACPIDKPCLSHWQA